MFRVAASSVTTGGACGRTESAPRMAVRTRTRIAAAVPRRVASRRVKTAGAIERRVSTRPSVAARQGGGDLAGDDLAVGPAARVGRQPAHDLAEIPGRCGA